MHEYTVHTYTHTHTRTHAHTHAHTHTHTHTYTHTQTHTQSYICTYKHAWRILVDEGRIQQYTCVVFDIAYLVYLTSLKCIGSLIGA